MIPRDWQFDPDHPLSRELAFAWIPDHGNIYVSRGPVTSRGTITNITSTRIAGVPCAQFGNGGASTIGFGDLAPWHMGRRCATQMTAFARVYFSSDGQYHSMIGKDDVLGTRPFNLWRNNNNKINFLLNSQTEEHDSTVAASTWHTCAGRYTGSQIEVYANNVVGTTPISYSTAIAQDTDPLNLGYSNASVYLRGYLSHTFLWYRALPQTLLTVLHERYPLYDGWIIPRRRVFAVQAPAAPAAGQPLYSINLLKQMSG